LKEINYIKLLPKNVPWKAILPAPYTFTQLSENRFYSDKTELMFEYSKILNEEIIELANLGFRYIQLSDPALIYQPTSNSIPKDELNMVKEALVTAVKGVPVKTCLQTFFGNFSQILPEALEFPVNHLGIDLYETCVETLEKYEFDKGVALGLIDARSSLVENPSELAKLAKQVVKAIYPSNLEEIFVCPNCDLEFLPWERAKEKIKVLGMLAKQLEEELYG
jgi:methionine synthase II (cobalamin-independent)